MTAVEFAQHLFTLKPGSDDAAAVLRELVEDVRYPATLAVERYLVAQGPDADKGKDVISDMRECALVPLASSAPMTDVATEVWALRTLCDELLDLRRETASLLKELLGERAELPEPPPGSAPGVPAGSRVCDLAFALLQRMLRGETAPDVFLSLPTRDKNRRIKEFQSSQLFRSLFEEQL